MTLIKSKAGSFKMTAYSKIGWIRALFNIQFFIGAKFVKKGFTNNVLIYLSL